MSDSPPLTEFSARPNGKMPQIVRAPAGCLTALLLMPAIYWFLAAAMALFQTGVFTALAYGAAGCCFAAAALGAWLGAGHLYRKLSRDFHAAGANWQDDSFSVFQAQAQPPCARGQELAAWAKQTGLTYYRVRKLPLLRKLYFMAYFGEMYQRIMQEYQRAFPDTDPAKLRYWRPATSQRERHWQYYLSHHPEFRAFAGDRMYAPWAGLLWTGALWGAIQRAVMGQFGGYELLVIDERVLVKTKGNKQQWTDATRVMLSSPYKLKALTIEPEERDSSRDIDFESVEFNKAFRIECHDKRWMSSPRGRCSCCSSTSPLPLNSIAAM